MKLRGIKKVTVCIALLTIVVTLVSCKSKKNETDKITLLNDAVNGTKREIVTLINNDLYYIKDKTKIGAVSLEDGVDKPLAITSNPKEVGIFKEKFKISGDWIAWIEEEEPVNIGMEDSEWRVACKKITNKESEKPEDGIITIQKSRGEKAIGKFTYTPKSIDFNGNKIVYTYQDVVDEKIHTFIKSYDIETDELEDIEDIVNEQGQNIVVNSLSVDSNAVVWSLEYKTEINSKSKIKEEIYSLVDQKSKELGNMKVVDSGDKGSIIEKSFKDIYYYNFENKEKRIITRYGNLISPYLNGDTLYVKRASFDDSGYYRDGELLRINIKTGENKVLLKNLEEKTTIAKGVSGKSNDIVYIKNGNIYNDIKVGKFFELENKSQIKGIMDNYIWYETKGKQVIKELTEEGDIKVESEEKDKNK